MGALFFYLERIYNLIDLNWGVYATSSDTALCTRTTGR